MSVNDIYSQIQALHTARATSDSVIDRLLERVDDYNDSGFHKMIGYQCTDAELQDFHEKAQKYIDARMSSVIDAQRDSRKVQAIIDYYYAPARQPLENQIAKNRADIAIAKDKSARTRIQITDQEQQQAALESKFRDLAGTAPQQITKQQQKLLQELLQRQSDLQQEVSKLTKQLDTSSRREEMEMLLRLSKLKTSQAAESSTTSKSKREASKTKDISSASEALRTKKVKHYAGLLSRKYRSKYHQDVDTDLASDSASFLLEQNLVGKKLESYLAVAAHILYELGVSLQSLRLDSKTYEIHIVKPKDEKTAKGKQSADNKAEKQTNLEPLRFRDGFLMVGDKKLKNECPCNRRKDGHMDPFN